MKLAANDICIEQLTLRGERNDTRPVLRAMQSIRAPDVGQRWYIIRQIQFRSQATQAAQNLGSNINKLMRQAVHGTQAGAQQANVVYFNSLDELLTQLSLDLSQGSEHHWYWQQWLDQKQSISNSQQLTQLWCKYSAHLPQLCQQLAEQNRLTDIFLAFSSEQLERIISAYCYDRGLSATHFLLPAPQQTDEAKTSASQARLITAADLSQTDHNTLYKLINQLPPALQNSWSDITVRAEDNSDRSQQLQLSLALLVSSISWQPTLVEKWQSQWFTLISHWYQLLTTEAEPIAQNKQEQSISISNIVDQQNSEHTQTTAEPTTSTEFANRQEQQVNSDKHSVRPLKNEQQNSSDTPEQSSSSPLEFVSEYGGIFYLINPIQRYLQLHPQRLTDLEQPDAGWALLWQLALLLAGEDKNKLLMDHGLQHCLEQTVGEEAAKTIACIPLQKLPEDIATAITEDEKLRPLCAAQRLQKRAHIQLTRSHLDTYFSSQYIDLDIRLAGLDINPGWVPWLGRVVHFHYRDEHQNYE